MKVLADQGVKEVTLLGQTVNSYKHTQDGRLFRLSDLLEHIHDVDGILRLKFVTNFPKDMSDDLLRAVRDLPKCAQYLHVPAQSGCNEMLKRMKRGYTVEDYREMFGRIRSTLPKAAVSSRPAVPTAHRPTKAAVVHAARGAVQCARPKAMPNTLSGHKGSK